jgi:hypothetical protein
MLQINATTIRRLLPSCRVTVQGSDLNARWMAKTALASFFETLWMLTAALESIGIRHARHVWRQNDITAVGQRVMQFRLRKCVKNVARINSLESSMKQHPVNIGSGQPRIRRFRNLRRQCKYFGHAVKDLPSAQPQSSNSGRFDAKMSSEPRESRLQQTCVCRTDRMRRRTAAVAKPTLISNFQSATSTLYFVCRSVNVSRSTFSDPVH